MLVMPAIVGPDADRGSAGGDMMPLTVSMPDEVAVCAGAGMASDMVAGGMRNGFALAITYGIGRTGRCPWVSTATGISPARPDRPVSIGREEQPAISRTPMQQERRQAEARGSRGADRRWAA